MADSTQLLLAFYGDDFTGSTDALEFLSRAGIKTVLFIQPPTAQQLARYDGLQAIGVAGATRSMHPEKMEQTLRPAFEALKQLQVKHVHYKVCSTFDSSPQIGSIGKAIDVGTEVFQNKFVPVLVAAPVLGRYCAFGNLFARMGIGSQGDIYRLDRHPSMSKHPVTPADESDLRLHLARQTDKTIGLMDILDITLPEDERLAKLVRLVNDNDIVLFDALYQQQMATIGCLLHRSAKETDTLFSVGSSGIEMALGAYWTEQGIIESPPEWNPAGKKDPILVISGSCSPVTAGQIDYAIANGFEEIALDTTSLLETNDLHGSIKNEIKTAVGFIAKGKSVIVHTSYGSDDPRVDKTKSPDQLTSYVLGSALGLLARSVASYVGSGLKRVVVAGGDTSSFAARAMGIEAVEMIAPLSPGAPLCRAYAPGSPIDGMEVNFKGGQVGDKDYFIKVLNGNINQTIPV